MALASYKMKKHGECLFAISKASPGKKGKRLMTSIGNDECQTSFDSEGKLTNYG